MEFIPPGYHGLDEFLMAGVMFVSFKAATEACIQITSAFTNLHLNGYAYQNIIVNRFMIDPANGNVLIRDNENIIPEGWNTDIMGNPEYMAPEVVLGKSLPNKRSDQFSMAVLFFILLCANHPLEGKRWANIICMTNESAMRLYVTDPLFVYDPHDNSNEPVSGIHNRVLERWKLMPQYVKDTFIKAFSKQALDEPDQRVREIDWFQMLCRFRSDIVKCKDPECEGDVFIHNAESAKCHICGETYCVKHKIALPLYEIPAVPGTRIYKCQLYACNMTEALDPIGLIVSKGEDLGIRNKSGMTWLTTTPVGKFKQVRPDDVIPVRTGIVFKIGEVNLEIK